MQNSDALVHTMNHDANYDVFLYTSHDAVVQILHQKIYDTSNNVISERHDVHALFAND